MESRRSKLSLYRSSREQKPGADNKVSRIAGLRHFMAETPANTSIEDFVQNKMPKTRRVPSPTKKFKSDPIGLAEVEIVSTEDPKDQNKKGKFITVFSAKGHKKDNTKFTVHSV